jgi:hypothetical protein
MDSNAILAAIIMARSLDELLETYTLREIESVFSLSYPFHREPGYEVPREQIWSELRSVAQEELARMFANFHKAD